MPQGWCPTRHLQHRSVLTVRTYWPLCHRAGAPPGTYSTGLCSLLQPPVPQGWCPGTYSTGQCSLFHTPIALCHRAGARPGSYSRGQCSPLQPPGLLYHRTGAIPGTYSTGQRSLLQAPDLLCHRAGARPGTYSTVSAHCYNLLASLPHGWCPIRHLQHRSVLTVTSSWHLCHRLAPDQSRASQVKRLLITGF